MKQKITDARVDYKGRLWLTFRTGNREYFTFRADDLRLEVTDTVEAVRDESRIPLMRGFRKTQGTITFTANQEPTFSLKRPRAKR